MNAAYPLLPEGQFTITTSVSCMSWVSVPEQTFKSVIDQHAAGAVRCVVDKTTYERWLAFRDMHGNIIAVEHDRLSRPPRRYATVRAIKGTVEKWRDGLYTAPKRQFRGKIRGLGGGRWDIHGTTRTGEGCASYRRELLAAALEAVEEAARR